MQTLSKYLRIRNLLVAIDMVNQLPPRAFTDHLRTWIDPEGKQISIHTGEPPCGTQACFGGWVAQYPFFQKQGVQYDPNGDSEPKMKIAGEMGWSEEVSYYLFGNYNLFSTTDIWGRWESDQLEVSDKKKILLRLKKVLEDTLTEE